MQILRKLLQLLDRVFRDKYRLTATAVEALKVTKAEMENL